MKIKAYETDNGFFINCPECKDRHDFTLKGFNEYYLNDDDLDLFNIQDNKLSPIFVCRNFKCVFEKDITVQF